MRSLICLLPIYFGCLLISKITIKNKLLFWFLLPSFLIATVTIVFCHLYTCKEVKNVFDQLEITADEMRKNVKIFMSGKEG